MKTMLEIAEEYLSKTSNQPTDKAEYVYRKYAQRNDSGQFLDVQQRPDGSLIYDPNVKAKTMPPIKQELKPNVPDTTGASKMDTFLNRPQGTTARNLIWKQNRN